MRDWKKWLMALIAAILVGWAVRWYVAHNEFKPLVCEPACSHPGQEAIAFSGFQLVAVNAMAPLSLSLELPLNKLNNLTFRNEGSGSVTVTKVELMQCFRGTDVPLNAISRECRYVEFESTSCLDAGAPKSLAPLSTCDVVIRTKHDSLTGQLTIETSIGKPVVPFLVQ